MSKAEVRILLDGLLEKEPEIWSVPTAVDWSKLEKKFKCEFPTAFVAFIDLMSEYSFPGDILNILDSGTNGNDTIPFTYDDEVQTGQWLNEFIPFYNVGNGDYFCINSNECPLTGVYYVAHDDDDVIKEAESFEQWLKNLPEFLA